MRKDIHSFHKYVLLPCLVAKMEQAGATLDALAEQSGICYRTIWFARSGKPIRYKLAMLLYQTLNERTFTKKGKYPAQWSEKRRLAQKRGN